MKLKKLGMFAPLTLALVISQALHAAPTHADTKAGSLQLDKPAIVNDRYSHPMYSVQPNENGQRILDMTNKAHYDFAKSRLAKAKLSEADYPQLHRSLDELKQQQIVAKSLLKTKGEALETKTAVGTDLIKNAHTFLNMQVAVSPVDGKAYLMVRAESSVYEGTTSTFVDLLLEDASQNQLAPMGATLTMMEGEQVHAVSTVSLDTLKDKFPNLESIYASSWVETEEPDGTLSSGLRFTEYAWDWDYMESKYSANMKSANIKAANVNQRVVATEYFPTAPVDVNGDQVIKVCLNRNHADCDYAADQYLDPNDITDVNIPFKGQFIVPHYIEEVYATGTLPNGIDEDTNIYLQEGVYGGVTKQSFLGLNGVKNFSDYVKIKPDAANKRTIIDWEIPRNEGRFGNAKLFSNIAEADWRINFAVKGNPFYNTRGRSSNFQVQINSNNIEGMHNFYTQALEKIKLGYSCLARGTMITMADGTQKAIEQIVNGDLVMGSTAKNSAASQSMKVVDTSVGVEAFKMFKVMTADGNEVLMTETHPVSTTNKGVIWAQELEEGDRIITKNGSVVITTIQKQKYQDKVYNLKLATVEGSKIAEGENLGMYANGMLVGDLRTQDHFNYKDQYIRESNEEKLQRMPEKWKTDFISTLNNSSK